MSSSEKTGTGPDLLSKASAFFFGQSCHPTSIGFASWEGKEDGPDCEDLLTWRTEARAVAGERMPSLYSPFSPIFSIPGIPCTCSYAAAKTSFFDCHSHICDPRIPCTGASGGICSTPGTP